MNPIECEMMTTFCIPMACKQQYHPIANLITKNTQYHYSEAIGEGGEGVAVHITYSVHEMIIMEDKFYVELFRFLVKHC